MFIGPNSYLICSAPLGATSENLRGCAPKGARMQKAVSIYYEHFAPNGATNASMSPRFILGATICMMAQRQRQNLFLRRFSAIESRHNRSAAHHGNPIAHPENFRQL